MRKKTMYERNETKTQCISHLKVGGPDPILKAKKLAFVEVNYRSYFRTNIPLNYSNCKYYVGFDFFTPKKLH